MCACIDANCMLFSTSTFICMSDDNNRVVLKPMDGHPDCQRDFINASYIHVSSIQHNVLSVCSFEILSTHYQGYAKKYKFIACQGE